MEYVRLVKPEWFQDNGDEFGEISFRKHGDGTGLSIFGLECAENESGLVSAHAKKYYEQFIADGPVVFCIISAEDCPKNVSIFKTEDPDPCHWGLDALNETGKDKGKPVGINKLKSYFSHKRAREHFYICDDDGSHRPLTVADTAIWKLKKMLADGS